MKVCYNILDAYKESESIKVNMKCPRAATHLARMITRHSIPLWRKKL